MMFKTFLIIGLLLSLSACQAENSNTVYPTASYKIEGSYLSDHRVIEWIPAGSIKTRCVLVEGFGTVACYETDEEQR